MAVYTHYNTQYHQCNGCCSKTRSEFDDLEGDDLLFEMEDEELGKSNDSVCMKCSAGSPDIPGGESSRGSIVQHGLGRPETLSIATANRMRRDEFYNTQYIKSDHQDMYGMMVKLGEHRPPCTIQGYSVYTLVKRKQQQNESIKK